MATTLPSDDRRASRTRAAIVDALVILAFDRRYDAIRVSDVIARAGVGRSTFYEHFRGKDDVLAAAMEPMLLALATAASGRAARSYVRETVRHLWERRARGRTMIDSLTSPVIARHLTEAIRPHAIRAGWNDDIATMVATGIAAAQLAMVKCWLTSRSHATIDDMTDRLIACAPLLRNDAT